MMKATTNHYAWAVITTKQRTMAAVATGVGRIKSLHSGALDRRMQFCTRAREIRQGGV